MYGSDELYSGHEVKQQDRYIYRPHTTPVSDAFSQYEYQLDPPQRRVFGQNPYLQESTPIAYNSNNQRAWDQAIVDGNLPPATMPAEAPIRATVRPHRVSLMRRPFATQSSNRSHRPPQVSDYRQSHPMLQEISGTRHHSSFRQDGQARRITTPLAVPFSSSPSPRVPSSPSPFISEFNPIRGRFQANLSTSMDPEAPVLPDCDTKRENAQLLRKANSRIPPVVQNIQLISLNELPDRLRSVFPFPLLNAVQSKCFDAVYKTDDNIVLSAPTGSGKTAVLEMAICRLVNRCTAGQYKVIYMAPTKSLCSERHRDWATKFKHLDLQCAELTGDTDQSQMRNVKNAGIIITTPEKWDSMTRKWKDHAKLIELVKLFLVDEVHILKDARGATLEAVVSRMKTVSSEIRFIALSATVPNSDDIAKWLGKDHSNQHLPAIRERFGEEFRPVKLHKFVYGLAFRGNDFAFESVCDSKLPEIISKHADKKPIMVFCCTRKATQTTARILAEMWVKHGQRNRYWPAPMKIPNVSDPELKSSLLAGVAFHHAGLVGYDRQAVEKGYLDGDIYVICCTSTLAVGVNLPCHLVIIKNTVSWQDVGTKEYADLEMMQMLGRAGRPQFDSSAVAVIITRQEKVSKYEKLVCGEEILESCLHLNLVEHLNAEIGLGSVYDLCTAKKWLAGTFLYVRLAQNPAHYKFEGESSIRDLDDRIEQICERDIGFLEENELITSGDRLKSTAFGEAMARYYVKFNTMVIILGLNAKAKMSEILSVLAEAEEFHEIRFRAGEKALLKVLNSASGMKFPIKVDIASSAQKRSILFQDELGGAEFPVDERFAKHRRQIQMDKAILFSHVHRLIRCIIDCQIHLQDAVAVRHALELARSLGARIWDSSPLQMKQIPAIGPVAVRKLVTARINSLEVLEATEPHKINMVLSKQPGFGEKILKILRDFPKLRVSIKLMGRENIKRGQPPRIRVKAELGFLNEKTPMHFNKKPVFVCFLAERSDGHLIDFRRISARNLGSGEDVLFASDILNDRQFITCYVMCDEMAGTMRYAELQPDIPTSSFPTPLIQDAQSNSPVQSMKPSMNISRRRSSNGFRPASEVFHGENEFLDAEIDDEDLLAAANEFEFQSLSDVEVNLGINSVPLSGRSKAKQVWKPLKLHNGKWACNHKCKDKKTCKHLCCREGVDKPPKAPKDSNAICKIVDNEETVPRGQRQIGHTKQRHPKGLLEIARGKQADCRTRRRESWVAERLETLPKRHAEVLSEDDVEIVDLSSGSSERRPRVNRKKPMHSFGRAQKPASKITRGLDDPLDPTVDEFEVDWMDDLPTLPTATDKLKDCLPEQLPVPTEETLASKLEKTKSEGLPSSRLCDKIFVSEANVVAEPTTNDRQPIISSSSQLAPVDAGHDAHIYSDYPSYQSTEGDFIADEALGNVSGICAHSPDEDQVCTPDLQLCCGGAVASDQAEDLVSPKEKLIDIACLPPEESQGSRPYDDDKSLQSISGSFAPKQHPNFEILRKRLPWDDIEGIDMDLIAYLGDDVEHV